MNLSFFAFAVLATAGAMLLTGLGTSNSLAIDTRAVATDTADLTQNDINLGTAFSKTLTCYAGIKPYFDKALVGPRTVSFDGDLLTISASGQTAKGLTDSGRFSTSGNPIERTDSDTHRKLHTLTGNSGGRIWLERDMNGELVGAGIIHRTGADRVECGDRYAKQWLNDSAEKPFGRDGNRLVWESDRAIDMNCIRYSGSDFAAPKVASPRAAQLQLARNGAMSLKIVGDTDGSLISIRANESERNSSFVYETVRDGGQRIWVSRRDSDGDADADADAIRLRFRFNYQLLDLEYQRFSSETTRCVPAPLDPRRSVEG